MVGIELVANRETKEPFAEKLNVGHRVILEARRLGVMLRPLGDVIVLMPPLTISEQEIDQLLAVTQKSIQQVSSQL